MKRLIRRIIFGILVVIGGLTLIVLGARLGAHLFIGNSKWARVIAWGDSHIDDYKRFPLRSISNAPPTFDFRRPSAETLQRDAPAFGNISYIIDRKTITKSFSDFLDQTDTVAFLVIKDDTLIYEEYFNGYNHNSTVTSFSVAKSFVSALIGIAISEGYIRSVDDAITKYLPELLKKDPRYHDIKLRHLLTMSSGIRYKDRGLSSDDVTTYYAPDLRAAAVSSPIAGDPEQGFHYNNYNPLLLGLVLERTTGRHVAQYLEEKIWRPLGMETPGSWSIDSEQSGFEKMESGINGRAIDFAKFGRLFLNKGSWDGTQIIPEKWVDESTRRDITSDPTPQYQYFWWVNAKVADKHHYFAAGKHGQYIYIVPDQSLIFVRFGKSDPYRHWVDVFEMLAERIAITYR
jgi:CubicO group peptidase (beta-lactamase class C family)